MLNFYTPYEFLSNFLCNWHEFKNITDVFLSTFINRSIDTLLEFWRFCQSSKHRFPPYLHLELSTTWYDHSIVTYKFQYSWRVWTLPVQGRDCDSCIAFVMTWYLAFKTVISGNPKHNQLLREYRDIHKKSSKATFVIFHCQLKCTTFYFLQLSF